MRRLLLALVSLAVLVVGAAGSWVGYAYTSADLDTRGDIAFERPLAIPPLAPSTVDAAGRRVFDLTLQHGDSDLGADQPTATMGINGAYLGPTLRAERGEQVRVKVSNELGESSTLHWHGMHLPARMDGGPHQLVAGGDTWSPTWRVDQPAATLWYHPHLHGRTAEQVYRGLAGMFIVDDPDAKTSLPSDYGVDDIPVIVQDVQLDGDGSLDTGAPLFSPTGLLGDRILVNGTPGPYLDVTTELVRLRLLNASPARIYEFGFDDGRGFLQVGTDGGLLEAPHETERVRLSPGERAEIVVAMRPGERSVLRSFPADVADAWQERFGGADDQLDVLELRAADELAPSPDLPARLAQVNRLDPADATTTRTFDLTDQTSINDASMQMERVDEVVQLGDTEIWEVRNEDGAPHSFHVHDVQFQVLDIDGQAPPPELSGWKDTVYVAPGSRLRLIMRFSDYADPVWPYMFHCHVLDHEDSGMMGQFLVVEPGTQPSGPPPAHEH
jgi:FtsP/CotA-like multicopper oxidase with cupredoxin domain